MKKITFENGETSVSAEVFLAFQDNIEEAIDGTTLFENWEGVSGDINLQQDYNQYSKIKIYAGKGEVGITVVEIPKELYDQKIDIIQGQFVESEQIFQLLAKQFYLDGTYLKVYSSPAYVNFKNKQIVEQGLENKILVYKVVGFE